MAGVLPTPLIVAGHATHGRAQRAFEASLVYYKVLLAAAHVLALVAGWIYGCRASSWAWPLTIPGCVITGGYRNHQLALVAAWWF